MDGNGIITKAKDFIANFLLGARKHASPDFRKTMQAFGSVNVKTLHVHRYPIESTVKHIANLLSAGALVKNQLRLNYDDIFHLAILFELVDGTTLYASKEEVLRLAVVKDIETYKARHKGIQFYDPINIQPTPLVVMFNNAEKLVGEKLWLYDALNNNCQIFVLQFLRANVFGNLSNDERKKLIDWIVQDTKELLGDNTIFKTIASFSTEAAAILDRALYGSSINGGSSRQAVQRFAERSEFYKGSGIGDEIAKFFADLVAMFSKKSDYLDLSDQRFNRDGTKIDKNAATGKEILRLISA